MAAGSSDRASDRSGPQGAVRARGQALGSTNGAGGSAPAAPGRFLCVPVLRDT